MAKATDLELEPYARLMPSKVKSLDDLVPFGYLGYEKYRKYFLRRKPFVEIETVQASEKEGYKQDPWMYKINRYNFRGSFNTSSKKDRIGFFGCSFTFGEGVKEENTFSNLVGNHFDLNTFNFGIGGAGLERVAKTFSAVNSIVDLDYAVVTLPTWFRQLHLDDKGNMVNIIAGLPHKTFPELSNFLTSASDDYYVVRASSLINWMYDIAKYKGIKLIFSSWDYAVNHFCQLSFPDVTIRPFPNIDDKQARDKMHPGVKSHRAHADQIIEAINDRAWIQKS